MAQGYSEESEEERGPARDPARARGGEAAGFSTLGQTEEKRFLGETHLTVFRKARGTRRGAATR